MRSTTRNCLKAREVRGGHRLAQDHEPVGLGALLVAELGDVVFPAITTRISGP